MAIKVMIEIDYNDLDLLRRHLREAQAESDAYAAESPEDFPYESPGFGTLSLGTEDVQMSARIVGIAFPREMLYDVEPLNPK